ncbi:MAG: substrate-binding domain-containing protein [Gemmataceae bacterium]
MLRRATWLLLLLAAVPGCNRHDVPDYRIVVIPKGLTNQFWVSIHRGAERAAADIRAEGGPNVQIIWDGPLREQDALEQIRIVDRRISTRVDGIVLAPQHSRTMALPVRRAIEQGIPVVVVDSGLEGGGFLKYVATDNYHGGQLAAERLLATLAADGKPAPRIVLLRYAVGSESTEQRERGFVDVVNAAIAKQKAAGQPTITWLSDDQYAGATKDSAMRVAAPLLNQFRGRIDGIFCPNESSAGGMIDALRSLGMNWSANAPDKVRLVGFDSSDHLLRALEEGDLDGTIVQDPYRMGYLGTRVIVAHLQGRDVSVGGLNLSTGENVITKDNVRAETTLALFDKAAQDRRPMTMPQFPPLAK